MGSRSPKGAFLLSTTTNNAKSLAAQRAAIARAERAGDQAAATEARRDYAAERLADYITRTVDAAPPLTDEQRERLVVLLRPSTAGGGRVA